MSSWDEQGVAEVEGELAAVADAAGQKLRAEADLDLDAVQASSDALVTTASSAMAAGYELSDIAKAEAHGKQAVRDSLRGDTLKFVARTGQHAREARIEHHEAIARAMRLGLSTREIAAAAGVTHGTVRAISNRLASGDAAEPVELE